MTTTISWPTRLPLPTYDSYALEPESAVTRTDMESGPARQRRRFTQTPTRIPVRWRMSAVDFATFEAWFRLKLADGAKWFAVDLLGGVGVTGHEARFLGQSNAPYKAVPSRGGIWIVTSVLEIRERPMLDEGALEILLAEDVPALFATIDMLHSALQTDLAAAVEKVTADSALLHSVVHGPATGDASLVPTEGGPVKTVARAVADAEEILHQEAGDLVGAVAAAREAREAAAQFATVAEERAGEADAAVGRALAAADQAATDIRSVATSAEAGIGDLVAQADAQVQTRIAAADGAAAEAEGAAAEARAQRRRPRLP